MAKRIKWKQNNKEMQCFGEEDGNYCIGLHPHATVLVPKDDVVFLEESNKADVGVVMPKRLTSENGAKQLMMGEFFEQHQCSYYDADGQLIERTEKVPVSWDTIKEMYAKLVEHYG